MQVTALGKGAAAAAAGGEWDDKPPSEPWSEQEQHKKVHWWFNDLMSWQRELWVMRCKLCVWCGTRQGGHL